MRSHGVALVARVTRVLWLTKGLGRGGAEQLLVNSVPLVDQARFTIDNAYVLPPGNLREGWMA